MKVLYVDDNFVPFIWELLEIKGHKVEGASRYEKGSNLMEQGFDFDVVLLDMNFSYEIEEDTPYGITVLKYIRQKSNIPVILFTMYNYSFCKEYIENYPNVSYCQKFNTERLLSTIEQCGKNTTTF